MAIKNRRIVAQLRNATWAQVERFMRDFCQSSGKGINRLAQNGSVTVSGIELTLYRPRA